MNGLDLHLNTRREFTQKACVTAASYALCAFTQHRQIADT